MNVHYMQEYLGIISIKRQYKDECGILSFYDKDRKEIILNTAFAIQWED